MAAKISALSNDAIQSLSLERLPLSKHNAEEFPVRHHVTHALRHNVEYLLTPLRIKQHENNKHPKEQYHNGVPDQLLYNANPLHGW
jgi:hypothetical protein